MKQKGETILDDVVTDEPEVEETETTETPEEPETPETTEKPETTETPESEGNDETLEAEAEKRGIANVMRENKRKADEIAELKKQIAQAASPSDKPKETVPAVKPPAAEPRHIADLRAYLKKEKFPDEYIDLQIKAMVQTARDISAATLKPAERIIYKDTLDATLGTVFNKPEYKPLKEALEGDLRKVMEEVPGQYWHDSDLVEMNLGKLIAKNAAKLFGKKSEKTGEESPVETETAGGGKVPSGTGSSEFGEFCNENGYDVGTPDLKAKAMKAFKAYKAATTPGK